MNEGYYIPSAEPGLSGHRPGRMMVRIDQWWWRQARDQTWWRWFYLSERTLGLYIDELERGKRTGMSGLARIGSS